MQNREITNVVNPAGFCVRFAAFLVDSIIVCAMLLVVRIPMWIATMFMTTNYLKEPILFNFSAWDILIYLLTTAYFVILTYATGATLGKKLFQIQVISTDEEKLTFFQTLYRETIGKYLSSLLCIGYLLIMVDSDKLGLHDRLADTKVIYGCRIKRDIRYKDYGYGVPPMSQANMLQKVSQATSTEPAPTTSAMSAPMEAPMSNSMTIQMSQQDSFAQEQEMSQQATEPEKKEKSGYIDLPER